MMNYEILFRLLFAISGIFMFVIRIYYQSRIKSTHPGTQERGSRLHLIPGSIAALVTIVFGFEYIFVPGTFGFAYLIEYRTWLRWVGALMLAIGISLLWSAHHSLGMSIHSLVVQKKTRNGSRPGLTSGSVIRSIQHISLTISGEDYLRAIGC